MYFQGVLSFVETVRNSKLSFQVAKWALFKKFFNSFRNTYSFLLEEKNMYNIFKIMFISRVDRSLKERKKLMHLVLSVQLNADANMHSYLGIEVIENFLIFSVNYSKIVIWYSFLMWVTRNIYTTVYAVARSSVLDSKYAHRWPIRAVEHHPKTVQVKRNLQTDINRCWMKHPAKLSERQS